MGPRIRLTSDAEFHERMAASEARAAAALASELSVAKDPIWREHLGRKLKRSKEQATFHRDTAARLRMGS